MNKKYKLTKKSIDWCGKKLFQIEAVVSFGSVLKGELGGYVESENNLAQVSGDARVYGDAWVYGNARVSGDAWVYGKIKLSFGYFFGMKNKGEEIKEFSQGEDKILYKKDWAGRAEIATIEEQKVESLVGQEVEMKVGGKIYKAKIVE